MKNMFEKFGYLEGLRVTIKVGNDGGWSNATFDAYYEELQLITKGRMIIHDAVTAATPTSS